MTSSTEIAVHGGNASTDLTLTPDQRDFTPAQIAALAQIGLENVPDGDRQVFFHQSKRTGLDPFARQIYMIGRSAEIDVEEVNPDTGNTRRVKQRTTKYTIQIGIDGYRLLTRRAADANGDRLGGEGPLWCGDDGVWRDVWPEGKIPTAAKFVIFRNGEPFPFVAHYSEYVQTKNDGKPNSMWTKMPRNQLAKCAEVGACRRAYPADFSGLVFSEAATIDEDGNTVDTTPDHRPPARARGVDKLRDRARESRTPRAETVDAEVVEDNAPPAEADANADNIDAENPQVDPGPDNTENPQDDDASSQVTPGPNDDLKMSAATRAKGEQTWLELMTEGNSVDERDALDATAEILAKIGVANPAGGVTRAPYRRLDSITDVSNRELKSVVGVLRAYRDKGGLADYLNEALNAASLRAAGLTEND